MIPPADLATRAERATERVEGLVERLELLAVEMRGAHDAATTERIRDAERMTRIAKRVSYLIEGMHE